MDYFECCVVGTRGRRKRKKKWLETIILGLGRRSLCGVDGEIMTNSATKKRKRSFFFFCFNSILHKKISWCAFSCMLFFTYTIFRTSEIWNQWRLKMEPSQRIIRHGLLQLTPRVGVVATMQFVQTICSLNCKLIC